MLYVGDNLRLIFMCYLWELALNVGLVVSLDNCKRIQDKVLEVGTKAYATNDEIFRWIITECYNSFA
jgi:hypothetical protein